MQMIREVKMKRLMILFAVLIMGMLAACSQSSTGTTTKEECNEHGCVTITIEGPVQAMKPFKVRVGIVITNKTEELGISFTAYGVESMQFEKLPDATEKVLQENLGVGWKILDAEPNKEYSFEGTITLITPPYKTGLHSYDIYVAAYYPEGGLIQAGTSIYLDDEGNQMASERVKDFLETEVEILPEVTGIIIFPTDTPNPTIRIPSATATVTPLPSSTSTPTVTPTLASYP
jgi:maltose-binding protein MalE